MHIHLGVLQALVVFADVVVIGFFWRIIAGLNHHNDLGKAMSFIY